MGLSPCIQCAEVESEVARCARSLARAHDLGQRMSTVAKWSAQLAQAQQNRRSHREWCPKAASA